MRFIKIKGYNWEVILLVDGQQRVILFEVLIDEVLLGLLSLLTIDLFVFDFLGDILYDGLTGLQLLSDPDSSIAQWGVGSFNFLEILLLLDLLIVLQLLIELLIGPFLEELLLLVNI